MPEWLAWPVIKTFLGGTFAKAWAALKSFFGSLNIQGWIGLAAACFLGWHWWGSASDARHWKRESGTWSQAYTLEKKALDLTKANLLAAATKAKEEDAANARRVAAEQAAINSERDQSYEARIAAARASIDSLQRRLASTTNPGGRPATPVPGIPTPTCGTDAPTADPITRAYDCAIQLDEMIKWATAQHDINPNEAKK